MRFPVVSCLCLILLSYSILPVSAENSIYQWVDRNKTYFSDRPHADAKVIALPEPQRKHDGEAVNLGNAAQYQVKRVVDGDTIQLLDDTKVRLLGINTPEVSNRYHSNDEAGGKRAKHWLNAALKGQVVRLETDVEKQDRYDRTLAHVFTQAGVHLNLQLVAQGMAEVSLYPPNLKYAEALIAAQANAERQGLGIWGDRAYAVKSTGALNVDNFHGWQRITGVVQAIRQTRRYVYLVFPDNFTARIHRSNLHLFVHLNSLVGHAVEVRGLVNQQEGQLSMLLRHPVALKQ